MAKTWSPTQKQYSEYERLLKRYNKIRSKIKRVHRYFSDADEGGRVPALVLPERHRKMTMQQIRITGKRIFRMKMKQLNKVVSVGAEGFFKEYKRSYLELYRTYIVGFDPEASPFKSKYIPLYYSEEQIKLMSVDNPQLANFMRDYNDIVRMKPEIFALFVKTGKIPAFKYMYAEFKEGGVSFYESFANLMHNMVDMIKHSTRAQQEEYSNIMLGKFSGEELRKAISNVRKSRLGVNRYRR